MPGAGLLLAGAGLSAGGSILNSALNFAMQKDQQAFNAEQAEINRVFQSGESQKSRDWQKEMSDTTYQRMIQDMQKAGVNPGALAGGSSASTPGASIGSSGSVANSAIASSSPFRLNDIFASAVQYAMAKDKHTYDEILNGMKTASAKSLQDSRNETQLAIASMRNNRNAHKDTGSYNSGSMREL